MLPREARIVYRLRLALQFTYLDCHQMQLPRQAFEGVQDDPAALNSTIARTHADMALELVRGIGISAQTWAQFRPSSPRYAEELRHATDATLLEWGNGLIENTRLRREQERLRPELDAARQRLSSGVPLQPGEVASEDLRGLAQAMVENREALRSPQTVSLDQLFDEEEARRAAATPQPDVGLREWARQMAGTLGPSRTSTIQKGRTGTTGKAGIKYDKHGKFLPPFEEPEPIVKDGKRRMIKRARKDQSKGEP